MFPFISNCYYYFTDALLYFLLKDNHPKLNAE